MAQKVTFNILLKVDLQCPGSYKKVKKILCKFPEIRDQVYDEKQNLVKITVVCCSPEQIRDKLCCKGCKVFKSIEIVEPPKQETKPQDGGKTKPNSKPVPPPNPKPGPTPEPQPIVILPPPVPVPAGFCCVQCSEGYGGGPCHYGYGRHVPPPPCYDNYVYWYGYGYGKGCYARRCDYFSEENTGSCNVM